MPRTAPGWPSSASRSWSATGPVRIRSARRSGIAGQIRTVVGVVGDVKVRGLERSSEPQMYLPAAQAPDAFPANHDPKDLVIRHSGQDEALIAAVRQIVRAVDPEQPISDVRPMDDVLARETASRRGSSRCSARSRLWRSCSAGVGIYGLLAYTVSQRSQEIGVRLALGADPSRVGRMILADGMRLALVGIVPGVLGAYAAARAMSALALWRRAGRSHDLRRGRRGSARDGLRRHVGTGTQSRAGHADVRSQSGVRLWLPASPSREALRRGRVTGTCPSAPREPPASAPRCARGE